jgi:hypothetical protein
MGAGAGSLLRRGLRRGLLGGHRGWQAILVVVTLGRLVRRVVRPGSGPVVHRQRLRVGEGIEIRHLPTVATNGSDPSGR